MGLEILLLLMLFPLVPATALLLFKNDTVRKITVNVSAAVLCGASLYLLVSAFSTGQTTFDLDKDAIGLVSQAIFALEVLIALYILYVSLKNRSMPNALLSAVLVIPASVLMIYFETAYGHSIHTENNFLFDQLSLVMALIIGIVGSLICVYAVGYMKEYHQHHKEVKDRRNVFFFVMFIFLSAMFGLVLANNISWLYFFWEVTTLCSFLLIGYSQTREATSNAFKALWMNLLGGLGFMAAIYYVYSAHEVILLTDLLNPDKIPAAAVMIPAALIAFAGLAKAAQMPFSSWLTGAMVAPTPVSALLHSSTMVKAGVYIIVRLAPLYRDSATGLTTQTGLLLSLVGGFTFLFASAIAISQSNAKRVLAYSTIANLGLVVACGAIGTPEAVWAAILLIIFHALAKSLLFLSVGTVEHQIHSRDIEDMGGLILRMPRMTVMMAIGMAGMFLAPFGMLISKWATLQAFADVSPLLVAIVAYGGAVTIFFWTKWLGKIISVGHIRSSIEHKVNSEEWAALYSLAILTVAISVLFPFMSAVIIEPFIVATYGGGETIYYGNLLIMSIMLFIVLLLPLSLIYYRQDRRKIGPYMSGRNMGKDYSFYGSLGLRRDVTLSNYYLTGYFGEDKLFNMGAMLSGILIAFMFGVMLI